VSVGKKKRISKLIDSNDDFAELEDAAWDDVEKRKALSQYATDPLQFPEENYPLNSSHVKLEDYEAPWAIQQVAAMDPVYCEPTEYNILTLLRLGNSFLKEAPVCFFTFNIP
jgi:hypothetical protein